VQRGPAHKRAGAAARAQVMVANIRCAELLEEQLRALEHDSAWASLRDAAAAGPVREFGARAAALLESCISGTPWRRASGAPREHARLRRGCLHCVPGILRCVRTVAACVRLLVC
jgi:hypothetical protein